MACTCWTWPEVSPLRQSVRRDRDQKCDCPLARVASRAARSIHATMRTSPVSASWTTAGTSPWASKAMASGVMVLAVPPHPARAGRPRWPELQAAGVDRDHDALTAESFGGFADHAGIREGGGVQRDLVGTRAQEGPDIGDAAHATADREGHVDAFGGAAHHLEHHPAVLVGGGDVEEDELVRPLGIVRARRRHGIAGVTEVNEAHPLDHPAVLHVETRDDPLG